MSEQIADFFRAAKGPGQIFVGITGGIGSGKSMVAALVREAGFLVLSSDDIARELMGQPALQEDIRKEFGDSLFNEEGVLDRKLLAQKVFGATPEQEKALRALNALVHPYVIEVLLERARAHFENGVKCIFNESALLFEAGLEDCYDYIIVVDAPEEVRIERLMRDRGMSEEEVRQRIHQQMPASAKAEAADFVITNTGSPEELRKAVQLLIAIVPALQPQA